MLDLRVFLEMNWIRDTRLNRPWKQWAFFFVVVMPILMSIIWFAIKLPTIAMEILDFLQDKAGLR